MIFLQFPFSQLSIIEVHRDHPGASTRFMTCTAIFRDQLHQSIKLPPGSRPRWGATHVWQNCAYFCSILFYCFCSYSLFCSYFYSYPTLSLFYYPGIFHPYLVATDLQFGEVYSPCHVQVGVGAGVGIREREFAFQPWT